MSVSEFPIPNEDESRRQTQCGEAGEDKWSPRFRLLIVVLSSLVLWSLIVVLIAWMV